MKRLARIIAVLSLLFVVVVEGALSFTDNPLHAAAVRECLVLIAVAVIILWRTK